jgi:hypothetical protein
MSRVMIAYLIRIVLSVSTFCSLSVMMVESTA